ncbi:MAG: type III pantothenate kinase [Clostridia bacterium]|nr:type III pantothenate kinase [Clostridia bacterium]
MIFTMDIGNTNIKTALFEGENMVQYWRLSTNKQMSSDEYGILLANLFRHNGLDMKAVTGIIISSVAPSINFTIEHMVQNYFNVSPMMVVPGIKTGINLKYDNPRELGSDRIANAVAAWELYGGPCIFIDFGTATTFGVMSARGEFLGGAICPGLKLASEALVDRAAKLPRFELVKPESAIGRNTIANLQSGIIYGHVGLVTYLIQKMRQELKAPDARVIATGGMALLVAAETDMIDVLDGTLTLIF